MQRFAGLNSIEGWNLTLQLSAGKSCLFCNNSRLDIVTKSGYNDNRIEIMIHDVVTGGKYENFI